MLHALDVVTKVVCVILGTLGFVGTLIYAVVELPKDWEKTFGKSSHLLSAKVSEKSYPTRISRFRLRKTRERLKKQMFRDGPEGNGFHGSR
jgi:hypothetical protein